MNHRNEIFENRSDAGKKLAKALLSYAEDPRVVVLGLPRGGIPVAYEVAIALKVPLDVFVVRKLGLPGQEELAMGAIASGGIRFLNEEVLRFAHVPKETIEWVTRQEKIELERREKMYRGERPPLDIAGKIVILVDDGLATGSTMRAAVEAVKERSPLKVIVAVPLAAIDTCHDFESLVDQIICLSTPEPFHAVGIWYEDFPQASDEEVNELLDRGMKRTPTNIADVAKPA
jgi:putative phosphoribosyl transferase